MVGHGSSRDDRPGKVDDEGRLPGRSSREGLARGGSQDDRPGKAADEGRLPGRSSREGLAT